MIIQTIIYPNNNKGMILADEGYYMSMHPFDYTFQQNIYSTPELSALYDESQRIERWLKVEAAIANAQKKYNLIPSESADRICAVSHFNNLDISSLKSHYRKTRNTIIPVLQALREVCGGDSQHYVHHGATTQDIIDTGEMMALQTALNIMVRELRDIEGKFIAVAQKHRATPMIGRSHGQHAIPITFGLKVAIWLEEIRRHIERLEYCAKVTPTLQLGGAVGTLAALSMPCEIKQHVAEHLGLNCTFSSWQTARDRVAEAASSLTMATVTLQKIANEIYELGRSEFAEVCESGGKQQAASSSTMPHKHNPVLCQRITVMATHTRSLCSTVMENMSPQHERDPRQLWSEWLAMPQLATYACTAAATLNQVVSNLHIYPKKMMKNIYLHGDLVASEWLLFRLSPLIGKHAAHTALFNAGQLSLATNTPLVECLLQQITLEAPLDEETLEIAKHPDRYIGYSTDIVDGVLASIMQARQQDTPLPIAANAVARRAR